MSLKLLPYKIGSKSAKELVRALRIKRIIPDGGYIPRGRTKVINWGASTAHFNASGVFMLNTPLAVGNAANKLKTFELLTRAGIPTPLFTTSRTMAQEWQEEGFRTFARHKIASHSGQGIDVVEAEDEMPHAPLYTRYQRKDKEYRVHVFKGKVIDITEKRKGVDRDAHPYIRNWEHGWVFCRAGIDVPDAVKLESVKAVNALGLDFGAVDVLEYKRQPYIVEVNSAPGLQGSSLQAYVKAFSEYFRGRI